MLHTLPPPLSESLKPRSWQQMFSWESVLSSLAKVQTIGYDEKVVRMNELQMTLYSSTFVNHLLSSQDIYGTLKITPVSSGYCLGSSNWIIMSDYEKIVYVSGSSTLTTHPRFEISQLWLTFESQTSSCWLSIKVHKLIICVCYVSDRLIKLR